MILNLLVLRAPVPDLLAPFYEGLGLQFVRERHGRGPEHLASTSSGALLEIYPEQEGTTTRGTRLGFAVADVDAAFANALDCAGAAVKHPCDGPWGRRAVLRDPAGHIVELTQSAHA